MATLSRIWGSVERPYTSYSAGYLHDVYESLGRYPVRIKEDVQFYDFRQQLINKFASQINI